MPDIDSLLLDLASYWRTQPDSEAFLEKLAGVRRRYPRIFDAVEDRTYLALIRQGQPPAGEVPTPNNTKVWLDKLVSLAAIEAATEAEQAAAAEAAARQEFETARRQAEILAPFTSLAARLRQTTVDPVRLDLPPLGNEDIALCLAWSGVRLQRPGIAEVAELERRLGDYEAARLLSARRAELVAIEYYRELGHEVEDVSITQLDATSDSSWMDFDLLVDGIPVDVKNSRRSFSSPDRYVEHCVPRFKQDRATSADVSILGVLSTYERLPEIAKGRGSCVILGEVKPADISKLCAWMRARFKDVIDVRGMWVKNYQPGWVFEYPRAFYRDRILATKEVDTTLSHYNQLGEAAQGSFVWLLALSQDRNLPDSIGKVNQLGPTLDELYELRDQVGLSRPTLYTYTMASALEALLREDDGVGIICLLRTILFGSAEAKDNARPLGLTDPQQYVASLLDVMKMILDAVKERGIRFTAFRLQHPSILKGLTSEGSWLTVLAYCGGWRSKPVRARCGMTPLHLGENEWCTACQHLICNICGFCSIECPLVGARQEDWTERATAAEAVQLGASLNREMEEDPDDLPF